MLSTIMGGAVAWGIGFAKGDPCFSEVVGRHFDANLVTSADPDEILPHFARNMGENFVSVGKSDPKHSAWEDLRHRTG